MFQTRVCGSRSYSARVAEGRSDARPANTERPPRRARGLLWTALPALDGPLPTVVLLAPLIPPLLGFGVLEVWSRYREAYGTAGRVGVALSALGLCFVFVPALLYATTDFGTQPLGALVLAIPAGVGVFSLWAGTVSLALALRNCGVVGTPLAVAFALALPASLLVNALMTPALGVGVGVYGLAWVAVATRLARPAEASADVTPEVASTSRLTVSSRASSVSSSWEWVLLVSCYGTTASHRPTSTPPGRRNSS
ncbi:hypothetical protein [Halospeciosus flavus]|uniref:hypothetical protein n=1 Tax=Halospeciosus flavus TaxID=3032283 RepID=UPI00360B90C8